jgi:hypothetical protein
VCWHGSDRHRVSAGGLQWTTLCTHELYGSSCCQQWRQVQSVSNAQCMHSSCNPDSCQLVPESANEGPLPLPTPAHPCIPCPTLRPHLSILRQAGHGEVQEAHGIQHLIRGTEPGAVCLDGVDGPEAAPRSNGQLRKPVGAGEVWLAVRLLCASSH